MPLNKDLDGLYRDILNFQPHPRELKRIKLISAVVELIAEEGIDEVTFESVGRKTKMARSHVVYYFKNRKLLIEAAIRFVAYSAQYSISKELEPLSGWKDLLTGYIKANFNWIKKNPSHATVMLLLYYQASFSEEYREIHTQARHAGAKRIEAILKLNSKLSRLTAPSLKAKSRAIQSIVTGHLINVTTTSGSNAEKSKKEALEQCFKILN